MPRIILNADDFGFSDETVRATIECFEHGGLTSATIMANMPATADAVRYAADHPQFSFGVHLTFTSDGVEYPVCDPKDIPALVGENGQFLPPLALRRRAMSGNLPADQVEREMTAQIARLRDAGLAISHVDSHGHVHKFKSIRAAMHRVLPKFDIRRVRMVQNVYFRKPLRSPAYWLRPLWRKSVITERGRFITTDHFYMPTTVVEPDWPKKVMAWGGMKAERHGGIEESAEGTASDAKALLASMPDASMPSLEIGVHPGYATEAWRDAERRDCIAFGNLARDAGCRLITWNDLRD
jgi:chitin disaccharide deacetylase